ncbi:MAG TPA: hypothetical protein VFD32_12100 [Dehalococcoidia bacterium]|nr:hypothetical protein [Dehalococcoidia bacterium]
MSQPAGAPLRRLERPRWWAAGPLLLGLLLAGVLAPGAVRAANAPGTVAFWKVYAPGWNLVAGPQGARLALHGEPLYSLDGSQPQYADNSQGAVDSGIGYWVFYGTGQTLLLVGVPQAVTQVHVNGGEWATLGNSGTKPASVRGADLALVYDPQAGFQPATLVQPGQAAMVYADSDADVFMDPYSPPPPRTSVMPGNGPATPPPALPGASTPTDELNYIFAINPILGDVATHISHFADAVAVADPARPGDQIWNDLRADADAVNADLASVQLLNAPDRYATVQADLVLALADISDGMNETVTGLLQNMPDRVDLGAGLLASGVRRVSAARTQLPQ